MAESKSNTLNTPKLRVLELYSGIGGMHWALKGEYIEKFVPKNTLVKRLYNYKAVLFPTGVGNRGICLFPTGVDNYAESGIPYEIVMAVDINSRANQIYQHNFPDVSLHSFGIEKLTLKKLAALNCNAILMSPPCQPFTRIGKRGDCDDIRTESFLHLLQLIKSLNTKPQYILVENVKGFETSRTRELLVQMLQDCHYSFQEFLLNPLQFGIPNSRLRYYLTARLIPWPHSQTFNPGEQILHLLPVLGSHSTLYQNHAGTNSKTGDKECDLWDISSCSCPDMLSPHENKSSKSQLGEAQSLTQQNSSCEGVHNGKTSCDYSFQDNSVPRDDDQSEDGYSSDVTPSTLSSCAVNDLCQNKKQSGPSEYKYNRLENTGFHGKDLADSLREQTAVSSWSEDVMALVSAGMNMRFSKDSDTYMSKECRQLSEFMETGNEISFDEYLLSDKTLRLFVIMDVILPVMTKSMCFSKRYGHCIDGAGSVIQMSSNVEDTKTASALKSLAVSSNNKNEWGEEELSTVRKLKLRYFTPREVANLMCFPSNFTFPEGFSIIQKYRVLGNSLNVHVVSKVIKFMVH